MPSANPRRFFSQFVLFSAFASSFAAAAAPVAPETLVNFNQDHQPAVQRWLGPLWRVVDTDHFTVYSDVSLRYHRLAAGLLEQFYQEAYPRFFTRPLGKLTVYLIDSSRDFEAYVSKMGFRQHAGNYGFYHPGMRTIFAHLRLPDGRQHGIGGLFHEAIHAFVHAEAGGRTVPAWLDEGFAALFEQGRIVKGKWIYGNPNPYREKPFRVEFESGRVPTLEQYFILTRKAFYADERKDTHYNVGRSLCLYLLRRKGERILRAFILGVLEGKSGREALEFATGTALTEIEIEWRTHIREVNFGGDYLERADEEDDALAILQEGVRNHPDYGMLRLALAEEYARSNQYSLAKEQAEKALTDPRLIEPHRAHQIFAQVFWHENPPRAMEALEQAIALQPWMERIVERNYSNLGLLKNILNDHAGATQVMEQLATLQREDSRGNANGATR